MRPFNLLLALLLGVAAALLCYGFQAVINFSATLRIEHPQVVLGLPILFLLTLALKKKTLYYPYKIKDLGEMNGQKTFFWNRFKVFYHFLGASLSHIFGASVGREGVIVLTTTGVVRFFSLSLVYWGPVAASIGFAAITGNKWVGIVFLIEMYTTQFTQKIWTFLGAWTAVLILQSLNFPHLLASVDIPNTDSYFKRFIFVLLLGVVVGFVARFYKKSYFFMSDFFSQKNIVWGLAMSLVLGYALYNPVLRPLQSLSLDVLEKFTSGSLIFEHDVQFIIFKLLFTLLCVSLGFFGGEYVPLVLVGSGLGAYSAQFFGESLLFGATLGAFAVFAGVTRLKWTAIVLCTTLAGFSMYVWVYLFYSIVLSFSGDESIYFDARDNKTRFMNFQFRRFQSGPDGFGGFSGGFGHSKSATPSEDKGYIDQ